MKHFILLALFVILFFSLKKKEYFSSYDLVLENDFPYLIKDESDVYFQSYKCLDYEDIRI